MSLRLRLDWPHSPRSVHSWDGWTVRPHHLCQHQPRDTTEFISVAAMHTQYEKLFCQSGLEL